MRRLTYKKFEFEPAVLEDGCDVNTALDRLAAYEDTGFMPEQIAEHADILQDIILGCKGGELMERPDCFAYENKRCKRLNVMLCRHKECPFYKTEEQYRADLKKYPPTGRYAECRIG